ncbi:MAG: hypothetical protein AAGF47_04345 [Planctomycetota bacterium]
MRRSETENMGISLVVGIGLGAAAWLVYAALVLLDLSTPQARFDSQRYHIEVIRDFAATWPRADVSDYLSATTPGYHWVMAGVWQLTASVTVLELLTSALAATIVGLAGAWSVRLVGAAWACVAALPLAASPYLLNAALSVLPDNAGWLLVLVVLMLSLSGPSGRVWVVLGAAMLGLVLVRQSHVWAAGVIVACGWLGREGRLLPVRGRARTRLRGLGAALVSVVPAIVVLGIFVWVWGGLAPPTFTGRGDGEHPDVSMVLSPVAPACILLLIGLYGPFWSGWLWPGICAEWGRSWRRVAVFAVGGLLVGLGLSLLGDSTASPEAGRTGGYWRLIAAGPVLAERYSLVLIPLTCVGGAVVGLCLAAMPPSRRWLMLMILSGFAAAQVVNANTWQRYYEPMVLMFLAIAAVLAVSEREAGDEQASEVGVGARPVGLVRAAQVLGPSALAGILLVLALMRLGPPG